MARPRILIVEDQKMLAKVLAENLDVLGHEVLLHVSTGEAADIHGKSQTEIAFSALQVGRNDNPSPPVTESLTPVNIIVLRLRN